uniref:Putative secreted peptide n=1 Tax=Anopheles braziliensis TaxID=58242 RepID=A0A2M3ZN45_9DIPT
MVLVQLGLVRPELVVLYVVVTTVRCHFYLAAEEQLIVRHLQRFVHIFRLLEAHQRVPVRTLADHLHPRHFAVLLVLVEQPILERGVGRAGRQVAHTDRQRPVVLRVAANHHRCSNGGSSVAVAVAEPTTTNSSAGGASDSTTPSCCCTAAAAVRRCCRRTKISTGTRDAVDASTTSAAAWMAWTVSCIISVAAAAATAAAAAGGERRRRCCCCCSDG